VTSLNNKTRGIFDDLSEEEIRAVIDYTWRHIVHHASPLTGERSTAADRPGNTTTLAVIELRPPVKYKALRYLDDGGPAPERKARVVLYRLV